MTWRTRRATGAAALVLTFGLVATSFGAPAQAADGSQWNPGNIVSNQLFYDANAMTQAEIQAFLNAKVPVCDTNHPAADSPFVCLKEYRETTETKPADAFCPGTYVGATNELASTIIYKVAQACNISAKALLVTLQKEQGLVTNTWPSQYRYDKAMGYGCSDTAACIDTYKGFFKQVFLAAKQFQRYRALPANYNYRVGVNSIHYHPAVLVGGVWTYTCPSQSVTIQNSATAGLYNYTPYVPNAAALANLYGTGDSCSSYGNRNFWRYWWDWFGDPTTSNGLPSDLVVDRISGLDRYATSVAISQGFTTGVPVVYIASGADYPDALAAAPASAKEEGPLLLVAPNAVPEVIAAELQRLAPGRIVVVGGPAAVSDVVYNALAPMAGAGGIKRLSGESRYETANAIVRDEWPAGSAPVVYVASGRGFADALSAAAAAGSQGMPVITVDGASATLDAATLDLFAYLGATEVRIAGGTSAVSSGLENAMRAVPGMVQVSRLAGQDRYATSTTINLATFSSSDDVYIASGNNFPDALSGAARAGVDGAALLIIPGSCVPRGTVDAINQLHATRVHILGGTSVVSTDVTHAALC